MSFTHSFHDSNDEYIPVIDKAEESAKSLEAICLEIFQQQPGKNFTVYDIVDILQKSPSTSRYPKSSVGRALTNLADKNRYGRLEKLQEGKPGPYGNKNHYYKLIPQFKQSNLFQ